MQKLIQEMHTSFLHHTTSRKFMYQKPG